MPILLCPKGSLCQEQSPLKRSFPLMGNLSSLVFNCGNPTAEPKKKKSSWDTHQGQAGVQFPTLCVITREQFVLDYATSSPKCKLCACGSKPWVPLSLVCMNSQVSILPFSQTTLCKMVPSPGEAARLHDAKHTSWFPERLLNPATRLCAPCPRQSLSPSLPNCVQLHTCVRDMVALRVKP